MLVGQHLLHLLHVDVLAVLLHDDRVQGVTKLVGHRLRHQFGAHRLSDGSLEMDAASHTGELEDLAVVLAVFVLSSLYLDIFFLVDQALKRSCGA